MQVAGLFLLILSIWTMYCGVKSFNPFSLLVAVLGSPAGAQALIAAANAAVQASSGSAPATNDPGTALPGSGGAVAPGSFSNAPVSSSALQNRGAATPADIQAEQQYAFQQLATKYGLTSAADQQALVQLWNHESGWRPNANNSSSGAYGIPQAYPGNKIPGGTNSTAQQQIDWGLGYIMQRYGSPSKAWAFEMSHSPNWY